MMKLSMSMVMKMMRRRGKCIPFESIINKLKTLELRNLEKIKHSRQHLTQWWTWYMQIDWLMGWLMDECVAVRRWLWRLCPWWGWVCWWGWGSGVGGGGVDTQMTLKLHSYRWRQFYRTSNGENSSSSLAIKFFTHGHARRERMRKWPWRCTTTVNSSTSTYAHVEEFATTDLDNSIELRTEKISPVVSKTKVLVHRYIHRDEWAAVSELQIFAMVTPMDKWPWHCTTIGQDNSRELRRKFVQRFQR